MSGAAPSAETRADAAAQAVYDALYDDAEARVCKDVPESACRHLPRNWTLSALALSLTKTGDQIANPKLTLTWLFSALGAPAFLLGLIAPVREAGALLPQLFIAAAIRRRDRRKFVWAAGSFGQAGALILMAAAALTLDGAAAGWTILALLAVFAVFRSLCSVSHKDVLGKTVSKTRRGAVGGFASSASGLAALVFGAVLILAPDANTAAIAGMLVFAAGLWILAALAYLLIVEEKGATQGGANAFPDAVRQLGLLKSDPAFARFVLARALMIATSISPPFLVAVARGEAGANLAGLGGFLIASAAAGFVSGWAFGRLADRSSRWVLAAGGALGAAALLGVVIVVESGLPAANSFIFHGAMLFLLALGHQGVRLGRSTYLVDLADVDTRAAYTAVSNTVIGILLLIVGLAAGAVFQLFGVWVLAGLAATALLGAGLSLTLKPVSG